MHELAITQNIVGIALNEARAAHATRITKISVVIGELTGIVSDSVQFYFDFLRKGNAAEGAVLDFRSVSIELRCRNCHTEFAPQDSAWVCPNCQGTGLDVIHGQESFVESIEIDK